MIFDECHHARKNHPYNGIMREYFQCSPEVRPKVFGMTASPVWDPKDAKRSLDALEKNLDSKVIAVREHVDELIAHAPKPTEVYQRGVISRTFSEFIDPDNRRVSAFPRVFIPFANTTRLSLRLL
jgi:hypothetical protein